MPVAITIPKELPAGIYCPTITFFQPTSEQELDLDTHAKHMEFLARAGINGVVLQGSTGEAVALSREERKDVSPHTPRVTTSRESRARLTLAQMIRVAKEAFDRVGNPGAIIAGTVGAQSTRENIQLCRDAAEAGADFTLILPPSYFPAMMTPQAIQEFYEDVCLPEFSKKISMLIRSGRGRFPHPGAHLLLPRRLLRN
jgi:dihydrodipicolinate synthase/N-acetylneuraminate lyase